MAFVSTGIAQLAGVLAADHRVVRLVVDRGFDWRAALVGAAAAIGTGLLAIGLRRAHNQPREDR